MKKFKEFFKVVGESLKTIHHTLWGKGKKKLLIAFVVTFVVLIVFFALTFEVTSKPFFCKTCHYMKPYYENWKTSSHSDVTCVACHFPPGIQHKIKGKMTALSMLVNYFTGVYKKSKPRAEIEDASCLRGGCHETRKLEGKSTFKEDIIFDHKPHMENLRRGKKLRCTSCHSQIVQGEHISVTEDTCFLCHFKDTGPDSDLHHCEKCHRAPVKSKDGSIDPIYDHTSILERKISCQKCHGEMIQGDGHAQKARCSNCHAEMEKIQHYYDTELMHKNHVTDHKIECQLCHTEIQHKSASRTKMVKPECTGCHPQFHDEQLQIFAGTGGNGVPEHPSAMYEAGLNCQACHVFHQSKGKISLKGDSFGADPKTCDECHGSGYSSLLTKWKRDAQREIKVISQVIKTTDSALKSNRRHKNYKDANEILLKAKENYAMVAKGYAIHNIPFAGQLLGKSYEYSKVALKKINSTIQLPVFETKAIVPGECSNCHSGIQHTIKEFYGWKFPHFNHVKEQKIKCSTCHSNEYKHGQVVMKRSDCMNCHHKEAIENCTTCHKTQQTFYNSHLEFSTYQMPNVMTEDVGCTDCHLKDDSLYRPGKDSCIECHDEDYGDIYEEWIDDVATAIEKLEDKISTEKLKKDSKAYKLLQKLKKDGSKGIHNPDLYQALIKDILNK